MLFLVLVQLIAVVSALASGGDKDAHTRQLARTPRFAPLSRRNVSSPCSGTAHSTVVRPTNNGTQRVIEVDFNGIPRYLLVDTGSADTWMISEDFTCLDSALSPAPLSQCKLGDAYTGPAIKQIGNDSYYQLYGTGEVVEGIFGLADVSVAGLTVRHQRVALVNKGSVSGDEVRSGVIGLAPRSVARLFENTNPSNTSPNGTVTPYSTLFESLYGSPGGQQKPIEPLFSLALQRGEEAGYIAFGGLPPVNFDHDFAFTPFHAVNYLGMHDPTRYYPIQPQGLKLNGVSQTTNYTVIVDSGTPANRLPDAIADQINAAFDPPATYNATLGLYIAPCSAKPPSLSFDIGNATFAVNPVDMFLTLSEDGVCATSIARGYAEPSESYPDGLYALGDAFLNGVIAVFDVGQGGMYFAAHNY